MKEKELVDNYILFQSNINQSIKIIKEFGYRQKKIDIVEFDPDSKYFLHGIEFKIKNWKLGFEQCLGNRILVPFNSLALYHKYIKNVNLELLKNYGIGLISIEDDNFFRLLDPLESNILNANKFKYFKENLLNVVNTNYH